MPFSLNLFPDREPLFPPERRAEAPGPERGDGLVPADATIGQVLDYAAGVNGSVLDVYGFGAWGAGYPIAREAAATYPTLWRAGTLIASGVAQLLTQPGMVSVVNAEGRPVNRQRAGRLVELLTYQPDGINPAVQWVEDLALDYALDGNALVTTHMSAGGRLIRLAQMRNATAARDDAQREMYRLQERAGLEQDYMIYPSRRVIHCRWPSWRRMGPDQGQRYGFALAPMTALRPALGLGLDADRYVARYFRERTGGIRSGLAITFERPMDQKNIEAAHQSIADIETGRRPLVLGSGAKVQNVMDSPQSADAAKLRELQILDVARAYGVPAPLIGVQVTQWGSGIEQLAKLWYRFGLRAHLDRITGPIQARLLMPGERIRVAEYDLLRGDADAIVKTAGLALGVGGGPSLIGKQDALRLMGLPAEWADRAEEGRAPDAEEMVEGMEDAGMDMSVPESFRKMANVFTKVEPSGKV